MTTKEQIGAVVDGRSEGCIVQGDCYDIIRTMIPAASMIFADPPDNMGLGYDGFKDSKPTEAYLVELKRVFGLCLIICDTAWFSVYHKWAARIGGFLDSCAEFELHQFIWSFTFGQHRQSDCGNCYRPIFRVRKPGATLNPNAIRVPSARQVKYKDKRADSRGRVPGDVWEFSRVCGTFKERCQWHPTQHPVALVERAILLSTNPGDLVVDPFSGTGTTCLAAKRTGRRYIGIEQSALYCEKSRQRLAQESRT